MKGERVSRQVYGNAVLRCYKNRWRPRCPNPLNGDLFRRERNLMLLRLLHDCVDQFLIALVRIRPANHRDVPQIILEGIVREFRRNHLKSAVDHTHDHQKPDDCFNSSHVPQSAPWDEDLSRPAEHSLKIFDYRGDRNIAHFPSLAQNDFHSAFGNLLPHIDSERDTH